MATPVISASSSILGFRRNESFEFQPAATNTPTSWAAVGLPSGVSINSSTGKISGAATVAGVYVVTVSATNADPATGTREFVLGIASEAAATVASADVSCEWDFDVVTRQLSVLGDAESSAAAPGIAQALAHWKKDDIFILRLRFRKNGVVVDPDPTALTLTLKELDPEPAIALSAAFERSVGTGESAYFDLLVDLSGAAVQAALSNYEEDAGTTFLANVEIQMEAEITFDSATETIRLSSRTGKVSLDKDQVE
jgi:hypothetical protein